MGLLRCDNCHSGTNYTAIAEKKFLQVWQLPPRQIERCFTVLLMLKGGSWAGTSEGISHGTAIRHQQPLRPGLQLSRNSPEPSRNVDWRRSLLCVADGRLNLIRRHWHL